MDTVKKRCKTCTLWNIDPHSSLKINVNKAKNIFIIPPHYHSGFYSTLEVNVNKAKDITTESF